MKNKIKTLNNLQKIIKSKKKLGKKIVHCHGVFDLLHVGHIKHFKEAKKLGDLVVVTLTSDKYVNKCLEKFKTNIDLNSTIEEFISSDVGKECKQKVPNKVVEHIYKIDLTQFLI